jgi:(p)ppGpp synthase/HD superfamily hydrolase
MLLYGSQLIYKADAFAEIAHDGQKRKYTGEPYITHPREVARLIQDFCVVDVSADDLEAMTAAALLHDVVEDCGIEMQEIFDRFGSYVATIVDGLTDESKPSDGNRAARKAIDLAKMVRQLKVTQMVKCGDFISNSRSIVLHDPGFAVRYLDEKTTFLKAMTHSKGTLIRAMAKATVKWGNNRLKGLGYGDDQDKILHA